MSERNLLIPILLVVVVGAPIVYHEMKTSKPTAVSEEPHDHWSNQPEPTSFSQPQATLNGFRPSAQTAGYSTPSPSNQLSTRNISRPHVVPAEQPFQLSGFPITGENPVQKNPLVDLGTGNRGFDPQMIPIRQSERENENMAVAPMRSAPLPSASIGSANPVVSPGFSQTTSLRQPGSPIRANFQPIVMKEQIDFSKMTPDYGAAETLVFPGNEFGPDLTAEPLEHLPVQDFGEIFQFSLTKSWVQQRWKRISTNPIDFRNELSGMRIPLVTGTNTWDLHGSLTYYFDTQQQLQRITFRGWTGDPQKLVNWLTSQFQFKPQPTTLAGFYLGETRQKTHGGIMLKTPAVIDANNPFQQHGIVMEMNRPDGPFELSDEFRRLIAGSHPR